MSVGCRYKEGLYPENMETGCRYKEGRYPENMETLTISNTSPLEADVSFCFLHDSRADTFLLDPPSMILKSGETQVRLCDD